MHLSDITQSCQFLSSFAKGALISGIYRSYGGTLIKLFGKKEVTGIYFNLKEKVFFPVTDLRPFKKEPITRLEEGLRANISGRIEEISLLAEYGKVVKIELFNRSLIIPLYGNRAVRVAQKEGELLWQERNEIALTLLETPMKHFAPSTDNPLNYQTLFLNLSEQKKADEIERIIEKKKNRIASLIKKLEKNIENYRADIEKYSLYSTLIKSNLYQLDGHEKKENLEITDFSNGALLINLDPSKTILQNMEQFFLKLKKAKNGILFTEKRVEELLVEFEKVEKGEFEGEAEASRQPFLAGKKQRKRKPYHEFQSTEGAVFLVGKEAKDNDELTFKIATPHDIWFHAKDYQGSHVILKIQKGVEPKSQDITTGCILAILYSKAKKGMSGEVWFTERKNVVKKKGMAPGKVMFRNAKSKYIGNGVLSDKIFKVQP
ncbi:MAG: NFACT RNA binding domain-containing protein [bacterium]